MKRLVLLGPPASGKGTQAERLSKEFHIPATSTGAILRKEKEQGTARGTKADEFTKDGHLVPDALIFELVEEWMKTSSGGFLFDGFPRTVPQGEWLEEYLESLNQPLDRVVLLEVPEKTIRERVLNRVVCTECGATTQIGNGVESMEAPCPACGGKLGRRRDDTEESLRQRLEEYEERTAPLIPFYESRGLLSRVSADREASEVTRNILALV